jgi:integrase
MPRHARGPYLWLRPARQRASGSDPALWIIRDAGHQRSTGLGMGERREAEKALADYIASKYAPARRERDIAEIPVADVISIYLADAAPSQARPEKAAERCGRLLEFFGQKRLNEVTGATCRAYTERRGSNGGARRDLQDLAAAIGHHSREGLHRGVVRVALPPKGQARQRWLTRREVAQLLWTCWRNREVQEGKQTDKRPLRHLARVLLIGVYTGSRPGAILNAAWRSGDGLSWVDTVNGVFHRHADGEAATIKRQPTVKLSPRLLAHLRRWKRLDAAQAKPHTYVVSYRGAKVLSVKTALHTACKLAGVDSVTAYTLRHTAASWLVARGLPTRKVADFIGTGEQMILSHYGHLAPDYQDEAAQAIGQKATPQLRHRYPRTKIEHDAKQSGANR